jgi:hypothetical protein
MERKSIGQGGGEGKPERGNLKEARRGNGFAAGGDWGGGEF